MRNQKYLALDLELNSKRDGTTPKIIEVGISIGSPQEPENLQTFNWYLDPQEPIHPEIAKLTGITDELIQSRSVSHKTLAEELSALIKLHDVFVNPITWGGDDATELLQEFRERDIHFPHFGRRIIDVKTIFVFHQIVSGKSPVGGLRKSMIANGLEFLGTPHRDSVDAENTLRFFFHYLHRQKVFEDFKDVMKTLR